ncbi:hypothetical protein LEAN103870_18755 [Legionella anisa]|nr:hypothetical protein [Legionella anisa]KTC74402.1 hypothetical protein Lani_0763 [Legionella anisa]MCW8425791.1 hypothetical protein [Legionella anisa]MCW8448779.1 hypothetical protein [Legionella anisa]UAK79340.1 hypothetical protein K8O89_17190 [Legionella anisa]
MMSKKDNGAKGPGDASKKWSFLERSKRVLDEEKSLSNSVEKETAKDKKEPISNSDNTVEAEPNIDELFRHK